MAGRDGSNFQPDNACTVLPRTTKFVGITHVGRGVFLGVRHALTAKGRCPALPNFWVSLLFTYTPFNVELPNVDVWGEGLFSGSSHAPPKGPGPNAPQFWGFMHTPFVAELSNLTWEERVYTPPIPTERSYSSQLLGFFCTYSYTL